MSSWPIECPLDVQWGDMDALGHVNNARYFTWFETARIALFEQIGLKNTGDALEVGPILAKIDCTFRAPLHYPDRIVACCKVAHLGNTSFVVTHAVFRESNREQPVAIGDGVCVLLNYKTGETVQVPGPMRAFLEQLQ